MIKIKNNGSPVIIGGKICHRGVETSVDEGAFNLYKKTRSGAAVVERQIDILSKAPDPISAPDPEPENEPAAAGPESDPEPEDGGDDGDSEPEGFKFDPEIHHIEHRGGGSWFVMELEEKVYGPISKEERANFEAIIKEHENSEDD